MLLGSNSMWWPTAYWRQVIIYILGLAQSSSFSFSSSLSTSLHPCSFPLPYLELAELLGWMDPDWKTSFVTSASLSPLPPSLSLSTLAVSEQRWKVAEQLPGCLPKALLIRRASFSTSPLSQCLFSRPPSHHCSGVQNVFLSASYSPRLFLVAYIKCYHYFFCLLFCHVPTFFLYKISICVAVVIDFCGEIVLNYAKAFVAFCFISLRCLFPLFYLSYSPFSTEV